MAKRIVDGRGIWRSDKLARVQPLWVRGEYANLIPLALANGSFECNPRQVWADVYSFNRPDITIHDVETVILPAFQQAGLLFTWAEGDGKIWGYWIGIEKPGRLPGRSRWKKHEVIGPAPPQEELRKFFESNGFRRETNGCIGSGSGSGSGVGKGSGNGSGSGMGEEPQPSASSTLSPPACAFQGEWFQITQEQHEGLCQKFPQLGEAAIGLEYECMDGWQGRQTPQKRWRNDYAGALNWLAREVKKQQQGGQKKNLAEERDEHNLATLGLTQ